MHSYNIRQQFSVQPSIADKRQYCVFIRFTAHAIDDPIATAGRTKAMLLVAGRTKAMLLVCSYQTNSCNNCPIQLSL